MADTMRENSGRPHSVFEFVNRGLDDVRRRVDEMLVRLDVGEMNVRGEVHSDIDRAVNMALLVRSRVHHLFNDLGSRVTGDHVHEHEHTHEHTHHAEASKTNGKSRGRRTRPQNTKG